MNLRLHPGKFSSVTQRTLSYIILLTMIISFLSSCSHPQHEKEDDKIEQELVQVIETPEIIVTDSTFLALFPEISEEKLHVFSPNERTGGNKFIGSKIPQEFDKYFSFDNYFKRDSGDIYTNIYSCYKIKLFDGKTGLIVRSPGIYHETAIDLLIWDNNMSSIVDHFKLADESADGEWHFVMDAWLTDLNADSKTDIITRRKDQWRDDVDKGLGKLHITDSINVSIAARRNFESSKLKIDTNQYKLFDWPKIN